MILKLKYFGMIAEAVGKENEEFECANSSVEELNIALKNKYAKLASMNYKIAVNQSFVEPTTLLKDNDEIALLPPFAGG
ncbi:MAG: MoaD/ThiS family protein [Flavobacteriales bacterium]|nr:MoaD/ThiS family protein [Flavobacteriales bacterium]